MPEEVFCFCSHMNRRNIDVDPNAKGNRIGEGRDGDGGAGLSDSLRHDLWKESFPLRLVEVLDLRIISIPSVQHEKSVIDTSRSVVDTSTSTQTYGQHEERNDYFDRVDMQVQQSDNAKGR